MLFIGAGVYDWDSDALCMAPARAQTVCPADVDEVRSCLDRADNHIIPGDGYIDGYVVGYNGEEYLGVAQA